MIFTLSEVKESCKPGDIVLTCNPAGLGKIINFGQGIEDGVGKSKYGHVAILGKEDENSLFNDKADGSIYESVMRISRNHIDKYNNCDVLIARHLEMTLRKYILGREEILDNLGQIYPVHRLVFHGLDMINAWVKRSIFRSKKRLEFRYMNFMPLDWPVCSELGQQFFMCAGCDTGIDKESLGHKKAWRGVNPDDFYDSICTNTKVWRIIYEGQYFKSYKDVK